MVIAFPTQKTPLDKMLESFPGSRLKPDGKHYEHNPGYGTHFDFRVRDDGSIGMKIWSGADYKDVLAEGEPPLKPADLYPRSGNGKQVAGKPYAREKLDLQDLADFLKLDSSFLFNLGYRDGYSYTNKTSGIKSNGVKMGGYCLHDGTEHTRVKVRLSLSGKFRFVWDENTPGDIIPCGLHHITDAHQAGYLFIGEGETDAATMWFHKFPFLGIPGASAAKSLDVSLLHNVPRVYIILEPDQAKKNLESGQGFYKSVRAHLRENGYTGEIFAIDWKRATKCKDPSDLHKVIYTSMTLADGTVQKDKIRAQFASDVEHAMQTAIPEGVTSLTEYVEPDPEPEIFPRTNLDFRQWITELNSVPSSTLSGDHKIVLQTIMLHTQWWDPEQERWFKVDSAFLAKQAGLSAKTFLKCVAYLTDKMGLFVKKKDTIWYSEMHSPKGEKKCKKEMYIHPAPQARLAYPCTYHVIEDQPERNHGGKRTPGPKCVDCGSENINEDIYKAHYCRDCHSQHMFLQEEQSKSYSKIEDEPESKTQIVLYSPNDELPPAPEEPTESDLWNELDEPESKTQVVPIYTNIYSESKTQVVLYSPDSSSSESEKPPTDHSLELSQIAHDLGAWYGDPCPTCACPIVWEHDGRAKCCRCHQWMTWAPEICKRLEAMFPKLLKLGA